MDDMCVIFDGNNTVMRAHHALKTANLSTDSGLPTGALFGSIRIFSSYVAKLKPSHVLWTFDAGKSKFRTEMDPEYKANRASNSSNEIGPQYDSFRRFLSMTSTRFYSEQGVEADDLIAQAVHDFSPHMPVTVITADHDLRQLVSRSPVVNVIKPKVGQSPRSAEVLYTWSKVLSEYNVTPQQLPEVWAMTGDSGDNIPGVPRVGWKTAMKIFEECDRSFHKCLDHPKIRDHRERVEKNFEMIYLKPQRGDFSVDLSECAFTETVTDEQLDFLSAFFDEWQLETLKAKLLGPGLWT